VIPVAAAAAQFWNKTVLWGVGGSAGAGLGKGFGFYGTGSVQIAVSPSGSAAYVITYAAPGATYAWLTPSTKGTGILGGSQFGFSNATDPSQLAGPGVDASGSLAAGLGIGVDSSLSIGGSFHVYVQRNAWFWCRGQRVRGSGDQYGRRPNLSQLTVAAIPGQTSVFATGGGALGWNGGVSLTGATGLVYGLDGTNNGFSGQFKGGNLYLPTPIPLVGAGGSITHGSGVTVVSAGAGAALAGRYTFGGTLTNTTRPLNVGKFTGFTWADFLGYLLRRPCN
jgi:hypothetical protein